jgi:hypothetical protein
MSCSLFLCDNAARILRQPQGSAMLVGVAGSGKQSLTRLAAFIGGFKCYQLELRRGYSPADFREDFKVTRTVYPPVQRLFVGSSDNRHHRITGFKMHSMANIITNAIELLH